MKRNLLILFGLVVFVGLTRAPIFSQQEAETLGKPDFTVQEWFLGDIIDIENNQLILSYINDNDRDAEIAIIVDEQTKYGNVNSLENIKIGDVASIDCKITPRGQATALNITVERLKE